VYLCLLIDFKGAIQALNSTNGDVRNTCSGAVTLSAPCSSDEPVLEVGHGCCHVRMGQFCVAAVANALTEYQNSFHLRYAAQSLQFQPLLAVL